MARLALLFVFLLSGPLFAQTIPVVGSSATLDVATWNVEDFGASGGPSNDQLQLENVLAVMRQSAIDVWALQEMNDDVDFDALLDSLGSGFAGSRVEDDFGNIGYGYIYKTDVINSLQISQILTGSSYEFAFRPPLQLRADVVLPDTTVEVRFINVHMKAGGQEEDYDRRVAASMALKNYTDNLQSIGANVLVLGDLNDELIFSIRGGCNGQPTCPSPYVNYLDDGDYLFITREFDQPGSSGDMNTYCSSSTCSSGSVLDHMVATNDLYDDYQTDSGNHFIALIDAISGYTNTTSDHLPVYARFDFLGMHTAAEGEVPEAAAFLGRSYPNPFTTAATVEYVLDTPGAVEIEVFDMLGRTIATMNSTHQAAGAHGFVLDGSALAPGVYVVRLTANGRTESRRIVRGR